MDRGLGNTLSAWLDLTTPCAGRLTRLGSLFVPRIPPKLVDHEHCVLLVSCAFPEFCSMAFRQLIVKELGAWQNLLRIVGFMVIFRSLLLLDVVVV